MTLIPTLPSSGFVRLVGDENFRREIVAGVLLRVSDVSIIEATTAGLRRTPDPVILEWAAANDHIVLTHDLKTLVPDAWQRVAKGLPLPGVVFVPWDFPIGPAIELLSVLLVDMPPDSFRDKVLYLANFSSR